MRECTVPPPSSSAAHLAAGDWFSKQIGISTVKYLITKLLKSGTLRSEMRGLAREIKRKIGHVSIVVFQVHQVPAPELSGWV
jgi:hypothetical protein